MGIFGNIFDRAARGVWLSPFERALLRLLEGVMVSGLVAGAVAVVPLLQGAQVDWANAGRVFLAAGVTGLLLALLKYAKAFGDQPLPVPPFSAAPSFGPAVRDLARGYTSPPADLGRDMGRDQQPSGKTGA